MIPEVDDPNRGDDEKVHLLCEGDAKRQPSKNLPNNTVIRSEPYSAVVDVLSPFHPDNIEDAMIKYLEPKKQQLENKSSATIKFIVKLDVDPKEYKICFEAY